MSEHVEITSDRERVEERVRRWCQRARLDGRRPALSDAAAVAIAAGRLDAPTRTILAERRRAGKALPSIGGFGALRVLDDERRRWLSKDTKNKPGSALVYRMRAADLAKRLDHLRTAFVMSTKHYATGVRAVRRDRRDGLHLDLDQRDALFDALIHTPVPKQESGPVAVRTGLSMLDSAADRVSEVAKNTRFEEFGDRAATVMADFADQKDDVFSGRYETLLFVAGSSFDQVQSSPAWRSEHFVVQRTQLNLVDELTQVAVDVNSLREIVDELDGIANMMFDDDTRAQVASRRTALDAVWSQLVDRVAALVRVAELVTHAEGDLRTLDVMQKAHSLDNRIDDLVARAGNRELSADNTHFVGDQLGT
ncbi:hypothetical protein QMK17_22505 [Rhodococcus sp. G-MC3]|uniref:hypothetical protein n=1 Tax=Rhodococcus sp. G-MC3 TaxID=3046209 RepID=UPI0024B8F4B0|nr:hypothetical protein [Rhodococcus sp. G-MC3]MDJ0396098.1 hypothetical protein [Rhodococcus sp. G-MC3]